MSHKPERMPWSPLSLSSTALGPENKTEEPRLSPRPYRLAAASLKGYGQNSLCLYGPYVCNSQSIFFQRLNQDVHMTLVNKCQAFYVKAQNILLGKVADSLIFHTNKLRHGEIIQNCCLRLPSLCVHLGFV